MIGEAAPDFELTASNGNTIRLSSLRSSYVLLIFYPKNDSPTCNRQLDDMSISGEDFFRRGVRLFGVNTAKVEKQQAYCERRQLSFPILSDPGGVVARLYNCRSRLFPVNRRTVVLVDPQGKICFFERGAPSAERVLKVLDETRPAAS